MQNRSTSGSQTPFSKRLTLIRVCVLAFCALLAVALFGFSVHDRTELESAAETRLTLLADVMAENIDGQLAQIEHQLQGARRIVMSADAGEIGRPVARDLLLDWCRGDPACMDLLVVNAAGEITDWTGPGTPPMVADREYVAHHLNTPGSTTFVGIPQLSRVHGGRWFFAVSQADRTEDGRIRRIYVSVRDLFHSFNYGRIVRDTPGASFAVVSTRGEVYVREPNREKHMGKVIPDVDRVLDEEPGAQRVSRIESRIDGIERLIVTRRLGRYPLYVAATQELEQILSPWRYRAAAMVLFWTALAAVSLYVARRLGEDARLQDYLASIDSLTGTLNRRALMVEARRQEDRRASAGGLGLLMLDVDHFKRINDGFGYAVGDEILQHVAATLRATCRSSDILGRYGGEEFLMLLPGADDRRVARVAEKLRAAIEAIPSLEFAGRGNYPDTLTASVGATVLRSGEGSLDTAISRADLALNQAKNGGRNRVVVLASDDRG
ncbi:MAG: GGDEF domain-containing protein [Rhodocyclaceae bacterium]|nr:GGDEF domain-containing protein [Rhodocyclaceae bacterium]